MGIGFAGPFRCRSWDQAQSRFRGGQNIRTRMRPVGSDRVVINQCRSVVPLKTCNRMTTNDGQDASRSSLAFARQLPPVHQTIFQLRHGRFDPLGSEGRMDRTKSDRQNVSNEPKEATTEQNHPCSESSRTIKRPDPMVDQTKARSMTTKTTPSSRSPNSVRPS